MEISYDPAKNEKNIADRGISFERVRKFDFSTAVMWQDLRKGYPEPRYSALGFIDGRLHCLTFTPREGALRVISLRKANTREVKLYEKETQSRTN